MFNVKQLVNINIRFAVSFGLLLSVSGLSQAQVTTSYTYDSNGRLIVVETDNAFFETFEFDDAGNITSADGATSLVNNPPVCTDPEVSSSSSSGTWNGLLGCTDPDGDSLTLDIVTDPPGAPTATITGSNEIYFQNLNSGFTVTTRTVSDGNGGSVSADFTVGYLPPPPPCCSP